MSNLLAIAGVKRGLRLAGTVYNLVAGAAEWLLDFSDEDNSMYLALLF